MKLPTSPKERNQMLVLGGVLVLLAAYAAVNLTVLPVLRSSASLRREQDELQERLKLAEQASRRLPRLTQEHGNLMSELASLTNTYLLRPVLGSYQVQDLVDSFAKGTGFTVGSVREVGKQEIPRKQIAAQAPATFMRLAVDVNGIGSYSNILMMIRQMEQMNPHIGLAELLVASQGDTPERHRVFLRLEWPIENELAKVVEKPRAAVAVKKKKR